jgi:haloalkane dehalogenase
MKFGVVHKDRMNRDTLTPYTAPFDTKPAQQALIKAGGGLGLGGLAKIAKKLPSLEVPLRLIYGEKDRVLPDVAKTMRRLKELRPDAELTALPNCGHFLQEDAPQRVGQLISDFLDARSA